MGGARHRSHVVEPGAHRALEIRARGVGEGPVLECGAGVAAGPERSVQRLRESRPAVGRHARDQVSGALGLSEDPRTRVEPAPPRHRCGRRGRREVDASVALSGRLIGGHVERSHRTRRVVGRLQHDQRPQAVALQRRERGAEVRVVGQRARVVVVEHAPRLGDPGEPEAAVGQQVCGGGRVRRSHVEVHPHRVEHPGGGPGVHVRAPRLEPVRAVGERQIGELRRIRIGRHRADHRGFGSRGGRLRQH